MSGKVIEKIERRNAIRKYIMIIIAIIVGFTFFAMCTSRCFDSNYYGGTGTIEDQRKRELDRKKEEAKYWKKRANDDYGW